MNNFKESFFRPGFLIDLILILLVYLFARLGLESAMSVIRESPAIFIGIGALLQFMAFAASALLLFPFKSDAAESAPKGQTILYAILLLPVIFGPQWLHIPADALLTESLKKSSWLAGSILGISIMTVYALQITFWIQIASREDQIKEHKSSHQLRRICAPAIATFLFFAELMILTGMQIMPENSGTWSHLALLIFSYLPTRLFLVFRPPFAWLELLSAMAAFAYLVLRLGLLTGLKLAW